MPPLLHIHTHTHTHTYIYIYRHIIYHSKALLSSSILGHTTQTHTQTHTHTHTGVDFHLVTSRQHRIQKETEEWISRHYPDIFTELHYGNHYSGMCVCVCVCVCVRASPLSLLGNFFPSTHFHVLIHTHTHTHTHSHRPAALQGRDVSSDRRPALN
jgi:hypothetical protein